MCPQFIYKLLLYIGFYKEQLLGTTMKYFPGGVTPGSPDLHEPLVKHKKGSHNKSALYQVQIDKVELRLLLLMFMGKKLLKVRGHIKNIMTLCFS